MSSVSLASRKLAVLAGFIVPLRVLACSCAPPPPPCHDVGLNPLVFLGTVKTATERNQDGVRTAQMKIDRSYKGDAKGLVDLVDNDMCDSPELLPGHQYLMYTWGSPGGPIAASGCSRSRAVENAQEDLKFLEAYAAAKTSTQVFGVFRLAGYDVDDPMPLKGVQVTLSGNGWQFRATTASDGSYSFRNIAPGEYEISAALKGYRVGWTPPQFSLSKNACYQANMFMRVERVVEGIVRDSESKPVAGALVELVSTKKISQSWEPPRLSGYSDDKGHYSIDGIPPGEYLLGVNIGFTPRKELPYSERYYPDTADPRLAMPLKFFVGASIQSFDLRLPDRLPLIKIKGRILKADGTPPRPEDDADVLIQEPRLGWHVSHERIKIDAEGWFEYELCEGIAYSAYAYYGPYGARTYSAPLEFIATKEHDRLLFVLDKTSKEFDALKPK